MKEPSGKYLPIAVAVIATLLVLVFAVNQGDPSKSKPAKAAPKKDSMEQMLADPNQVQIARSLLAQRKQRDKSIWADEIAAQRFEESFVTLWDQLRTSEDPWTTLGEFKFSNLKWNEPDSQAKSTFEMTESELDGATKSFSHTGFVEYLQQIKRSGYRLIQSEWHHAHFEPRAGDAPRSTFNVSLHIQGPDEQRIALNGQLQVEWDTGTEVSAKPVARALTVRNAKMLHRIGSAAFTEIALPMRKLPTSMPLLAYDLNADGLSEIILPPHNLVYWNRGNFEFEPATLMETLPAGLNMADWAAIAGKCTAVIDEFTGDNLPDLVLVLPKHGAFLYPMSADREFTSPPVQILPGNDELKWPKVVTSGDVNGDGKTDLWFGQYLNNMYNGAFPDPIFDATNGHPAYLLINEGNGTFRDATETANLGPRRTRLTYSASFWDFDTDGDLDLVTVNDFSGVDAYRNDGTGNFENLPGGLVDERANFGMGHIVADLNNDNAMDFYVAGMSSTTARRLEALGLGRDEFPDIQKLRMKMGYGSRLYYGNGKGHYRQAASVDQVARTGWSWGIGAFDFGNDGWTDLYVANGHISRESCRDYCTKFWTHDIYTDPSLPVPTKKFVFGEALQQAYGQGIVSWNGYEKNKLFLNRGGTNYLSAGFQMGVAFEYDSRTVIAEDFDVDGRVDLLLVEEDANWNRKFDSRIRLYRNIWEQNGNWIGLQLALGKGGSLNGTRVAIETDAGKRQAVLLNGDSFAGQHSATKHFGLGNLKSVKQATVHWPDGKTSIIERPAINRYHRTSRPD